MQNDSFQVNKLKIGDIDSFDSLFLKYSPRIYKFSLKYLKSEELAEELTQEVFLNIWEKRGNLDPSQSFNSYIFTISYNLIRKHFIKKARENTYKNELIHNFLDSDNNLDRVIDYKLILKKVENIIESLPPRRKEIYLKKKYEGLTIRQISEDLGISPNTVENQLTAAQRYLIEQLSKNDLDNKIFLDFLLIFVAEYQHLKPQ